MGDAPSAKVSTFLLLPHFLSFAVFFARFQRQGILDYIEHRSLIKVNAVPYTLGYGNLVDSTVVCLYRTGTPYLLNQGSMAANI